MFPAANIILVSVWWSLCALLVLVVLTPIAAAIVTVS